jgi:hypothetical protein
MYASFYQKNSSRLPLFYSLKNREYNNGETSYGPKLLKYQSTSNKFAFIIDFMIETKVL